MPTCGELVTDVAGDLRRLGQVAAHRGAVAQRPEVDAVGVAGLGQQLSGPIRVVGEGLGAVLVLRDARRQELVGRDRALRVEVLDDAVLVDGVADRLAQLLVVERRLVDVEAEVEDVERLALDELEVGVAPTPSRSPRCPRCRCRRRRPTAARPAAGPTPRSTGRRRWGSRARRPSSPRWRSARSGCPAPRPRACRDRCRSGCRRVRRSTPSSSCSSEKIPRAENATFDGNATSGLQSVNVTVCSSTASMPGEVAGVALRAALGALVERQAPRSRHSPRALLRRLLRRCRRRRRRKPRPRGRERQMPIPSGIAAVSCVSPWLLSASPSGDAIWLVDLRRHCRFLHVLAQEVVEAPPPGRGLVRYTTSRWRVKWQAAGWSTPVDGRISSSGS